MPLIDRLIDQAADGEGRFQLLPIAQASLDAQHFVFDLDAKCALENLAGAKPSSVLAALQLCKLPFDHCWMEWPGDLVPGMERRRAPSETEEIPKTIGVLLERKEGSLIMGSFVFEARDGRILACPCAFVSDWSEDPNPMVTENSKRMNHVDPAYLKRHGKAEEPAAAVLSNRLIAIKSIYTQQTERALRHRNGDKVADDWIQTGARDATGETLYVQAALCLLNSRSCVELVPSDLSKINRARQKSRKRPLVSYSTVKIALSRADRRAAGTHGMSREEIRQHIVRGHFKVKRGGIYWWRPHIRGSLKHGEVRRAGYEVKQ